MKQVFLAVTLVLLKLFCLPMASAAPQADANGIVTISFGKSKLGDHVQKFYKENCKTNQRKCVDKALGDLRKVAPSLKQAFALIPPNLKNFAHSQCSGESVFIYRINCWAEQLQQVDNKGLADIDKAIKHLWQASNRNAGFAIMTDLVGYEKHPALLTALKNHALFWVDPFSIAYAKGVPATLEVFIRGEKRVKPKPVATPSPVEETPEPIAVATPKPEATPVAAVPKPAKNKVAQALAESNPKLEAALQALRGSGGGTKTATPELIDALLTLQNMALGISKIAETHQDLTDADALRPEIANYLDATIKDLENLSKNQSAVAKEPLEKALAYFQLLRQGDVKQWILEIEFSQLPNSSMKENFCPWFLELQKQAPSVTVEWSKEGLIDCATAL